MGLLVVTHISAATVSALQINTQKVIDVDRGEAIQKRHPSATAHDIAARPRKACDNFEVSVSQLWLQWSPQHSIDRLIGC